MSAFDPQKLADLVEAEAKKRNQVEEISLRLHDQYETDKAWDEQKLSQYMADQQRHAQLSRELETVTKARERYEATQPKTTTSLHRSRGGAAFGRWLMGGASALDQDEQTDYIAELNPGEVPQVPGGGEVFRVKAATRSDITTGTDAAGEAAVIQWEPGLVEALAYYGAVARSCFNFSTATGNTYNFNQMDSASEEGGSIADQASTTLADQNLPVVTNIAFSSYIRHSSMMSVRLESIQDIQFDLPNRVMREAMRRLGRGWNRWFTSGDNSSKPQGIVPSAKVVDGGAGSLNTLDFQNLMDLEYGINLAYLEGDEGGDGGFMDDRRNGMIGFMMHRNAEKSLRRAVDADNRPLWLPSLDVGQANQRSPGTLIGYPYSLNNHMDDMGTTNNKPVLFGNCGHYGVRNVAGVDFYRFFDSRTVQSYSVQFIAFSRRDGRAIGPVTSSAAEAYAALQIKT